MSTLIVNKLKPKSGSTHETSATTLKMTGSTSGDLTFEMDQDVGTAANFQIVAPASTQRVDLHYDKSVGNTAVMSFASQKVGINNINPAHALDVAGSAQVSSDLTVGGDLTVNGTMTTLNTVTVSTDDPNIELNAVGSPSDANADGGGLTLKGTTDKTIAWSNTTDTWQYNQGINITSGKMAIGTAAATTSNLEIEGASGDLVFEIDNNVANSANLQIIAPASTPRIDLHLDKDLGNTAIMSFKDQRVGINNISPTKPLDVSGDIRHATASGDLTFEMANSASNSSTFKILNGAGNKRADMILDDNTHITMKDQRVGILQTAPTTTLDVTGDARITTDLTVGDDLSMLSDGAIINFGTDSDISLTHAADTSLTLAGAGSTSGLVINNTATDGDPFLAFALSGTQTFTMGVDDGDSDTFKIGTTAIGTNTRFAIDSSGKVGIGTSAPASTLELEGSSGDIIFEMDNNASNSANFQIQNGAGNNRVDLVMNALSANTTMTFKGQKVGVMNTNPSTTLDVTGDANVSTDLTIGGVLALADGSASAPSLTNNGDTNCGLFFSAADTLAFTAAGTAQVTFADGLIAPVTTNDVNLGTADLRFANIFTMDLHLANERGDWTVIEEEDYLSLRNNKNGKMFKILMQEISEE
jgi:hypothetical protein